MKTILIVTAFIAMLCFGFISLENPNNEQCTAIAKSTGRQCKSKQWGECPYAYCYAHCK